MASSTNSLYYFLFACIPLRIILAILPLYLPEKMLLYLGLILLVIGTSFLYLYFNNLRLDAPEAGGITWWAKFRLIHGALYLTASHYAFTHQRIAWIPLTMDVILGFFLFLQKHEFITFL